MKTSRILTARKPPKTRAFPFPLLLVAAIALTSAGSAYAQRTLLGTNYTEDFNDIGNGLPTGWTVRTGASLTNVGTVAAFNTAKVSWGATTGQFANQASTFNENTNVLGTAAFDEQAGITNRCPAIRQTGSFGDPGAAFVLQIANTIGITNLNFSIDLNMLSVQLHSTIWRIEYAVTNALPTNTTFTGLGTYTDPGVFGPTTMNFALGADANNQPQNVWIRIVTTNLSTGSGSRDTFGIDNFSLTYSNAALLVPPTPPTITNPPPATLTSAVGTPAIMTVGAGGTQPLYYQWYKGGAPVTNGGNIAGATTATLTINPAFHSNAGNYTVVVTNAATPPNNSVTSSVSQLTVVGFAIAPLSVTNTVAGTPLTIGLNFVDNQTSVTSASGISSNQTMLPNANISGSASGSSGSITMTPVAGLDGVVFVNVTASDGSFTTNAIFPLMVTLSTNVIFVDHFDYASGSVTSNSLGLWRNHSGPAGEMIVTNGELRVSRSLTEDVNALLIGQPYSSNGPAILYSRFRVRVPTTLPTAVGNYFAHFMSPFNSQRARVWTSTRDAASGYRLGIGNAETSTAATAQLQQDLDTNATYTVVTSLNVSNGLSTIWINPTVESDPSTNAADAIIGPVDIISYAFRQDGSEGILFVDDLVVATSFSAALGSPAPAPLSIQRTGTDVVLTWPGTAFNLQASPTVTGTYTNIPGATSPHTESLTNAQRYYRLKYP